MIAPSITPSNATSTPYVSLSTRLGEVHPLSVVLPAVLRQYGVSWPLSGACSEKGAGSGGRCQRTPDGNRRKRSGEAAERSSR
jgi:hypothetical protein